MHDPVVTQTLYKSTPGPVGRPQCLRLPSLHPSDIPSPAHPLSSRLLLLHVRLPDEIPTRLLGEHDLEAVKVGSVLKVSHSTTNIVIPLRPGSCRRSSRFATQKDPRRTFLVCLAASFLAQPLCSHFSSTPAFSTARLMAPLPAPRGSFEMV